jgi:ThiF family
VLLIGAGGLGSPLGLYLTAAGVGRIGLVDFDVVDYSNLQRQVIHGTKDVGRPKPQSAAEGGVLGILPGIVWLIQAAEAVKLILGEGDSLIGRLLLFNALQMRFRELKLRRDPNCPLCGDKPVIRELIDYDQFCGVTPPEEETAEAADWEITVTDLKAKLDRREPLTIIDVRDPHEWEICNLAGYGSNGTMSSRFV